MTAIDFLRNMSSDAKIFVTLSPPPPEMITIYDENKLDLLHDDGTMNSFSYSPNKCLELNQCFKLI